jgi:hypothetical protein
MNPIQLVWSQVKGYIAGQNKTIRLCDVFSIVTSALSQITSQRSQAVIDHIIKEEGWIRELDGLINNVVDQLVINTDDAETSSNGEPQSSDMDSNMKGIHPLSNSTNYY